MNMIDILNSQGVKVGERVADAIPIVLQFKFYTGAAFFKALTISERGLMVNKAKSSDEAGAIFEQIKLSGLDFNDPDDMAIGVQMIAAGILADQARLDVLTGGNL